MIESPLIHAINRIRREHGDDLLILGHHYQDSSVVAICDVVGDSLELSRQAAASKATRIVFCGVRFMAETADILVRGPLGEDIGRKVYLPALGAGCPMAEMAEVPALEAAWTHLATVDPSAHYRPVVYVNSTAEVKAFCGRHGGSACTSGNGAQILKHFLDAGDKILFAPDQHLCSNILHALGYRSDALALWKRALPNGGLTPEQIRAARLIAWDGCCVIHAGLTTADVVRARAATPDAQLLIHPEAPLETVAQAEMAGSTKAIIDAIERAPAGGKYLIGTEQHLVQRLIDSYPQLEIHPLRPIVCQNMSKTRLEQVLYVLETFPETHRILVDASLVLDARACVQKMLSL
ncbi:MAG: quinolinate synthase NadA [Kiritimatiellia bacterium]